VLDDGVYRSREPYPASPVRIIRAGSLYGRELVLVEIMPVAWDPAAGTLETMNSALLDVRFSGGAPGSGSGDPVEDSRFGFVENYGSFGQPNPAPDGGYLIIAHPDFVDTALDAYVTWKTRCGYPVTLVSTTVTGTTAAAIDAYIENAIQTWETPPEYVLLVGDTGFLVGGSATAYGGVTDLYYSCVGTSDYFPDVALGRFSVQTTAQCILMAQRTIDYEQWNYGSGAWMQNTGWIGCSDSGHWNMIETTHNFCIDAYCTPMGYTADKLYPVTYGANAADVTESVNSGLSLLVFSGHGSQTSWGDMAYGPSDFAMLNNASMLPGVCSHACLTGDYATATCWAETWTRTPGKGGIWFWGSVPSSLWDEDDFMQRREIESFLDEGNYWTMSFLNDGKMEVYEQYSGGGYSKYYFEGYNLMGDPSLEMWTWQPAGGIPMTMTVTHPASISGSGNVTVTVAGATDDALVCLWKGDEVYERGWTTGGSATFMVEPATPGDLLVTVRRHNYKPYLGTITVTGTGFGEGQGASPLTISCSNPLLGAGVVTIGGEGPVTLEVFDMAGRVVSRPFQGEIDGTHSVSISEGLSTGVYFARLTGASGEATRRLTVIR